MLVENILIKRVGDVKSGTSDTTGKPWASRNILLAFEDETGESYISATVDTDVWNRLGYAEGQTVSLNLRFRTRRFLNGFVANDIRILDPQNPKP
ncbi:MAG: DUF3127 domain-containing protein [Bacteroidaceae bacterium]|nr:DUF3127 domain-containing protein [Bacteroidaceae bacterium]